MFMLVRGIKDDFDGETDIIFSKNKEDLVQLTEGFENKNEDSLFFYSIFEIEDGDHMFFTVNFEGLESKEPNSMKTPIYDSTI